jgi:hypothetical protein
MPSMVVIFAPSSTLPAGTRQARFYLPSMMTVHVPHCPSLQQTLHPVK